MQVDNPIRLVRELKGAPISIILVLSFARQRVTQEWLERATGYTDKPVSQALAYLEEIGLVDHTRAGWMLTGEARQLPLGLAIEESTTETQSEENCELGIREEQESRNISDSTAAAISLSSSLSNDLKSSCCNDRNFSDSGLVKAVLAGEGIGPPMLDTLAGGNFDPVWVYAHVCKWRREGKSRGILITRLKAGDRIKFERTLMEELLAEAFPDYFEWGDEE